MALRKPYFIKHYYHRNQKYIGSKGSDRVIYSPGITVFKDDEVLANRLPADEWFNVDVITCAAPRLRNDGDISDDEVMGIHVRRGRNILKVAMENGVDVLVLGAFGCGAFHNPPYVVAEAYRRMLQDEGYSHYFKRVIFAVKKDNNDNGNFQAFDAVLNV